MGIFLSDNRELAMAGLDAVFEEVRKFHTTFGHPAPDTPIMQNLDKADARANWIIEEAVELKKARSVEDQADAYLDALYFAIGGFVELGIKPGALFDLVHSANMAKVQPDGSVKKRADGKVMKPEDWQPPEPAMRDEIAAQKELKPLKS